VKVELTGVPETQLWNLYNRAAEARQPNSVLEDPRAVALVDSIDYPFERFGKAQLAQWHALRVLCFDREINRFLAENPGGTVVALGEGLETQFWRVDDGRVRWLTVDLSESVELRRQLLPDDPQRRRSLACSALDYRWMDEVDAPKGVLITTQGLLMYLQPAEVKALIAACADRFPGGALIFDALPRGLVERSRQGKIKSPGGYQAPAWQWGMNPGEHSKIMSASPNIADVRDLPLPRGRGLFALAPWAHLIPVLRKQRMSIVLVRFGAGVEQAPVSGG
jgi:O-methyltransferase involved in polyketide biosynthesis